MPDKPEKRSRGRRRQAVQAASVVNAYKGEKGGRKRTAGPREDSGPGGTELFGHLCEILEMFPNAGEDAEGALAGKVMAARLRRELAAKHCPGRTPEDRSGRES